MKKEKMSLEKECQEHWLRLGIDSEKSLKKHINAIFEKHADQGSVLEDIYRLVLPDWNRIEKVCGYPEAGDSLWRFICRCFQKFDRKHHIGCMPGGSWMNTGFSVNHELDPWEIGFDNCVVILKHN